MPTPTRFIQLRCPQCSASVRCGPEDRLMRLRQAGLLRREKEPEAALVHELFLATAARFICAECGCVGLTVVPVEDEFDDAEWGQPARNCEACRQPIPAERLELFPHTTLCVACQRGAETGQDQGPAEYCPRCGNVLVLRAIRRGVTEYALVCPECGA
jgi:predicted RNA-binding Zn-ribbon protein involved in translation (DUF1610 family)